MDLYICLGIAAYSEHILSPMALSVSFAGVGGRGKKERGDASSASSHFPSFLLSFPFPFQNEKSVKKSETGSSNRQRRSLKKETKQEEKEEGDVKDDGESRNALDYSMLTTETPAS